MIIILLESLNLIKGTVHLYLLPQRLDMDLLYICQEEQNLIVSRRNVTKLSYLQFLLPFIVPGTVSTVNVNVLNISTIEITWLPVPQEEAYGNITHYTVSVSLFEGRELYNRKISVSSRLHVIVNGLCKYFSLIHNSLVITGNFFYKVGEIPYGVTVKANNDIGLEGQSNTTVIFTREGSKYNNSIFIFHE